MDDILSNLVGYMDYNTAAVGISTENAISCQRHLASEETSFQ